MDRIPLEVSMWGPKGLMPSLASFDCIQDSDSDVAWQDLSEEEWAMMRSPEFKGKRHVKTPSEYCRVLPK